MLTETKCVMDLIRLAIKSISLNEKHHIYSSPNSKTTSSPNPQCFSWDESVTRWDGGVCHTGKLRRVAGDGGDARRQRCNCRSATYVASVEPGVVGGMMCIHLKMKCEEF